MAEPNTEIPGGVVDLYTVITEINNVQQELNLMVDTIIGSTNSIVLAAKVKIAKRKIKRITHSMAELVNSVSQAISEMIAELDTQGIHKSFSELVNNPAMFALAAMTPNMTKDINYLGDNKAGVLELILGLIAAINIIIATDIPSSRRVRRHIKKLNGALGALKDGLLSMVTSLQSVSETLQANPINQASLDTVLNILLDVRYLFKQMALIAFWTSVILPTIPIAVFGVMTISLTLKTMMFFLGRISSPEFAIMTQQTLMGVKKVLGQLIKCIWLIAASVASIAITTMIIAGIGSILPSLFMPFLKGLSMMLVYFGIMWVMMKIIAKISNKTATMSFELLINMLITAAIIVVLAGVFLLLAQISDRVKPSMMNIIVLLGFIGIVLLAIMGLMAIAAIVSPALALGMVAMVMIMVTITTLILLIGALMLLTWAANFLDAAATIDAVNKVMFVARSVILAVLDADFTTDTKEAKKDNELRILAGELLGENFVNIIDMATKAIMLMMTTFVVVVLIVMIVVMLAFVALYNMSKPYLDQVPTAVSVVMFIAENTITSIVGWRSAVAGQEGDAKFDALIKHALGGLMDIVGLLFKVIIIAQTIVVLAMLMVLMGVMLAVHKLYTTYKPAIDAMPTVVGDIMKACDAVIFYLTQPAQEPEGEERQGLGKLLHTIGLGDLADIVGLLCKFVRIGLAIMALSILSAAAKMMNDAYTTYLNMGGDNIGANAAKMVQGIGEGINVIIREMEKIHVDFGEAEERDEGKFHWKVWNVAYNKLIHMIDDVFGAGTSGIISLMDAAGNMRAAVPIITALGSVAEYVSRVVKIMSSSMEGMRQANSQVIPEMMNILGGMVSQVNTMQLGDLELCDQNLQKIDETCRKITGTFNNLLGGKDANMAFVIQNGEKYAAVVADTDKLVNRINGLDIAKMETLAKMFGNAAAFSQSINGNFDKLAEVLSEKIAPIIEGLQKTIEDADKHIEEYTKRQEEAQMEAVTKQTEVITNVVQQVAPIQPQNAAQPITRQDNPAGIGANQQIRPIPAQLEHSKTDDIAAAIKTALRGLVVKVDPSGKS